MFIIALPNPCPPQILIDDEGLNDYLWRFIECWSFVEMQERNNLPILLAYKYSVILLLLDCLVSSFHFLQAQLVPKLRQEQTTDGNVRRPHLSDRDSHAETSNFDLPPLLHAGIRVSLAAGHLKTTSEGDSTLRNVAHQLRDRKGTNPCHATSESHLPDGCRGAATSRQPLDRDVKRLRVGGLWPDHEHRGNR
jgi:hypothetical protein